MSPTDSSKCTYMPSLQSQESVTEPQKAKTEARWMKRRWKARPLLIVNPPFGQSDRCPDFLKITPSFPSRVFYLICWENNPLSLLFFLSALGLSVSRTAVVWVLMAGSHDSFSPAHLSTTVLVWSWLWDKRPWLTFSFVPEDWNLMSCRV